MSIKLEDTQTLETNIENLELENEIDIYHKTLKRTASFGCDATGNEIEKEEEEEEEILSSENIKTLFYKLTSKISILSKEIYNLNKKLDDITVLQEETLYSVETSKQNNNNQQKLIELTPEKKYSIN